MYERTDFGTDWQFKLEQTDNAWRDVRLPHDWSVEGEFDQLAPAGGDGGFLPCGVGLYRKTFRYEPASPGETVSLRFDGVYQNCRVRLNGTDLGGRNFGYLGFGLDLTPHLLTGDNRIEVRVDNSAQPNSRWYSGSGVTRPVRLCRTGAAWLAWHGIGVRTEDLPDGSVEVRLDAALEGLPPAGARVRFIVKEDDRVLADRAVMPDPNGPAASDSGDVGIPTAFSIGRAAGRAVASFILPDPRRWSPDEPFLYGLDVVLADAAGHALDAASIRFGIRTIAFDRNHGFLLNGKRLKLRGLCLHHDGGCAGAAVPAAVWQRRLRTLRQMGCNALRMSHNPPDPALLDLCDRMGFCVMDEAFDEWTIRKDKNGQAIHGYADFWDADHTRDLADMIRRDRNHPSVVLWSIGNEIPEQTKPGGEVTARELVDLCHRLDPTRMVTSACDNIQAEPVPATEAFLAALDVVGANYINRWRNRTELLYAEDRHAHPDWCLTGSEHGCAGGFRGRYEVDGQAPHPWFGDYRSRLARVTPLLKYTEVNDFVAGDFLWTGIDYLGESRWPHKHASCGALDTCGFPKDAWHFYRSVWTEAPVLHLFPHWNWPGREGRVIAVQCCTNCDTVELRLNGRSFGRKSRQFPLQGMTEKYGHFDRMLPQPTTTDLHLSWDVPYEPGTLEAVGWREGIAVCRETVVTTDAPYRLELVAEDPEPLPGITDMTPAGQPAWHQAVVRVLDAAGRLVPDAEIGVAVKVSGDGELAGMDNGMPEDRTCLRSPVRSTLGGLAYVLVRRTGEGAVLIRAACEGLAAAALTIGG